MKLHSVIILFAGLCFFLICCKAKKNEDPFEVARNYCNCVEEEMKTYKDALINIYDCEKKVFSNSRLINIYMSTYEDYTAYNQGTKDSAEQLFLQVRNITDTLCFNKFDAKRIKTILHIPM